MFSEFAIRLRNFNQHKGAIASVLLLLTSLTIGWHFASNHLAVEMNKRGISYHKIEEFKSAKISYKIAIFLKSDYGQAYYNLGSLYEDENDDENDNASAIREYEQAIKYNNPAAYNNLGRIYLLKQREPDCYRAAFLLLEGLEIATKDLVKYGLLTNLGRAQLCLEEHEKAQEYLATAIAINGDRPEAYCILAPVMDYVGDESATKDALAKCPIDSVNLPELDNWLIAKGGQKMLEQ
jgi:tetratricopeptide (TPR) repeat protein